MTIEEFRLCDARDVDTFLAKHVPLHRTRAIRAFYAGAPTPAPNATDSDPSSPRPTARLAHPLNATHPPERIECTLAGRSLGGADFNETHVVTVGNAPLGWWNPARLGPSVFGSELQLELLSPPVMQSEEGDTVQQSGAALAMAADVVSDWSSMSVAAFASNLVQEEEEQAVPAPPPPPTATDAADVAGAVGGTAEERGSAKTSVSR